LNIKLTLSLSVSIRLADLLTNTNNHNVELLMNNSPSMEQTRSEVLVPPSSEARPLDARQQSVINKLFRRLIVFLFILFVFSYLDRINIGFAGLTMGKDLGLTSTMFGLATTLFYVMYVICGIPSNIMLSIVGARRWIAILMVVWGIASTATMFATGPNSLYAENAGGDCRSRLPAGAVAVLNLLVPGAIPRPRQCPVYDCDARHHGAWLAGFRYILNLTAC
jgi:MFS family permease